MCNVYLVVLCWKFNYNQTYKRNERPNPLIMQFFWCQIKLVVIPFSNVFSVFIFIVEHKPKLCIFFSEFHFPLSIFLNNNMKWGAIQLILHSPPSVHSDHQTRRTFFIQLILIDSEDKYGKIINFRNIN